MKDAPLSCALAFAMDSDRPMESFRYAVIHEALLEHRTRNSLLDELHDIYETFDEDSAEAGLLFGIMDQLTGYCSPAWDLSYLHPKEPK